MAFFKQIGLASVLGAMIVASPGAMPTPANAMPNVASKTEIAPGVSEKLTEVRDHSRWGRSDRRRHWNRNRRHYRNDVNPGAFIALGIMGALVNRGLSERSASSAMERCDARFRSFEWNTGLYTTYGGDRRLCPYLR